MSVFPSDVVIDADSSETCQKCGRKVFESTGDHSWWNAEPGLWEAVYGTDAGIRCIPCFTDDADAKGISVSWRAVRERRAVTPAGACQRCAAAGLPQEPTEPEAQR